MDKQGAIVAFSAAPDFPDADAFAAKYGEAKLWRVARLPFRDFLAAIGLRRVDLNRFYGIPLSTADQWIAGKASPPRYMRFLLAIAEGYIKREE